jgi:hypothetical protein
MDHTITICAVLGFHGERGGSLATVVNNVRQTHLLAFRLLLMVCKFSFQLFYATLEFYFPGYGTSLLCKSLSLSGLQLAYAATEQIVDDFEFADASFEGGTVGLERVIGERRLQMGRSVDRGGRWRRGAVRKLREGRGGESWVIECDAVKHVLWSNVGRMGMMV